MGELPPYDGFIAERLQRIEVALSLRVNDLANLQKCFNVDGFEHSHYFHTNSLVVKITSPDVCGTSASHLVDKFEIWH